jgi:hypothetical protein
MDLNLAELPPGIDADVAWVSSGGYGEWMRIPPRKYYTMVYIVQDGKVHPIFLDI